MAQSLAKNLIHLIYSTKNRERYLTSEIRPRLFEYQTGIFGQWDCAPIVIGGDSDHVHALFVLSKNRLLCRVVEEVKKGSSKWIKLQGDAFSGFYWQSGYGAFSVSQSHVSKLRLYIEQQEQRHQTVSFQDEFRLFLKRYMIEYDERYVWD